MRVAVILLLLAVWQINAETIQQELVRLTNEYRAENSLPAIPMSYQLTKTAIIHTLDMAANGAIGGDCNLHSWSNKGFGLWNGCCYTSNHTFAACMWNKPKEISGGSFNGNGYENAAAGRNTAAGSLELWKASSGHNDVILNKNTWAELTWKAIGGSVCGSYAVLWFSDTADTSSTDVATLTCSSVTLPSPPAAPSATPVADNTPVDQSSPVVDSTPTDQSNTPQGSTPSTSNSPSASSAPSAGPSKSNSPSNNLNKPSSGHIAALAGSAVAVAFAVVF